MPQSVRLMSCLLLLPASCGRGEGIVCISELGTRDNSRDSVTMFAGQKIVTYCIIAFSLLLLHLDLPVVALSMSKKKFVASPDLPYNVYSILYIGTHETKRNRLVRGKVERRMTTVQYIFYRKFSWRILLAFLCSQIFAKVLIHFLQGWALRSFSFRTFRSFPF